MGKTQMTMQQTVQMPNDEQPVDVRKDTFQCTYKKSSLQAKDSFDYARMSASCGGFLPCDIKENLEDIEVTFNIKGKKPFSKMNEESKENQIQILTNIQQLFSALSELKAPLEEQNLWYDENNLLYLAFRDVYVPGEMLDEKEFQRDYLILVCGKLGKYSCQQLSESGLEIVKEEKGYEEILACQNPEELASLLRQKRNELINKKKKENTEVSKLGYTILRIVAIVACITAVIGIAYFIRSAVVVIPKQKAVIAANEAFIQKDYVACIDSLKTLEPEDFDKTTRYILAVSYASSESFKKEEIALIVERLSPSSNEKELNYWIYLGRLDMTSAEDLAMSLSDDKLLVYAYMKEYDLLESDTTTSGEDKKSRLDTLTQEIDSLGKKYEDAEAAEAPSEDVGAEVSTEDVGAEEPPKDVGAEEPPEDVGAELPAAEG